MQIRDDDVSGPEIVELLEEHIRNMHEWSPAKSVHALDLEALRAPEITFLTAWEDGLLMGCGALKALGDTHGEVKSMRTPAARRGRGAARLILRHIIGLAEQREYELLSLETGSQLGFGPARALYERHGFVYCGPFAGYTDDPNSIFMELRLPRTDRSITREA